MHAIWSSSDIASYIAGLLLLSTSGFSSVKWNHIYQSLMIESCTKFPALAQVLGKHLGFLIWPSCCHPCLRLSVFTASLLREELDHTIPQFELPPHVSQINPNSSETQPRGTLSPPPHPQPPLLPASLSHCPLQPHWSPWLPSGSPGILLPLACALLFPPLGKFFPGIGMSGLLALRSDYSILITISPLPQHLPPSLACWTLCHRTYSALKILWKIIYHVYCLPCPRRM